MASPLPLWQQVALLVLAPPIMGLLIVVMNRGWAGAVAAILGTRVSDTTRKEQAWEFWFSLWLMYAIGIGMFIYAHLFR